MNRATFSDDTTSGRWSTHLRGSRKVTIVARAEDSHGFDWLAAFKREFLPQGVEAKSSNVLPILDAQPRARQNVLKNVEGYSIFIVDLHESRRRVLGDIVDRMRPVVPPGLDPFDFVLQIANPDSEAYQFLRQMALNGSVLWILIGGRATTTLRTAGCGPACPVVWQGTVPMPIRRLQRIGQRKGTIPWPMVKSVRSFPLRVVTSLT